VFLIGLIMLFSGLAMAFAAFFAPSAALPGLIGGAAGLAIAGFALAYLGWPQRRRAPAPGMARAEAWILNAEETSAEVTGYRMVELTLDVRPKDSVPFQVTRKFVGNRSSFTVGSSVPVWYDPIDPKKVELA